LQEELRDSASTWLYLLSVLVALTGEFLPNRLNFASGTRVTVNVSADAISKVQTKPVDNAVYIVSTQKRKKETNDITNT